MSRFLWFSVYITWA